MRILRSSWLPLLTALLILLSVVLIMMPLKNPISLDDGLRHIAMARLMHERGVLGTNGWSEFLYAGTMSQLRTDPWFLADALLVPLAALSAVTALKILTLAEVTVLLGSFLLFLKPLRLRPGTASLLLLFLLFGEMNFFGRLLIGRPFPLMTAVLILALWALFAEEWLALAVLLAVAPLLSHLFIFPLGCVILGAGSLVLSGKIPSGMRAITAAVLGTVAGLALHPSPLAYLRYLAFIFVKIPFEKHLGTGGEIQYGGWMFDSSLCIATAGLLLALILYGRLVLKISWAQLHRSGVLSLCLLAALALLGYLAWVRTIDVLWPLLLIAIARTLHAFPEILPHLQERFLPASLRRAFPSMLALLCVLRAGSIAASIIRENPSHSLERFAAIRMLAPRAQVLNVDWDLFPPLVLLRPDLRFATGMDPTFTFLTQPELSRLLTMLRSTPFHGDPPVVDAHEWVRQIKERIPGRYLVLETQRHQNFIRLLEHTSGLRTIALSGSLAIFDLSAAR